MKRLFSILKTGILDYIRKVIEEISNKLCAAELSKDSLEVICCIARYIVHQIQRKFKCNKCSHAVEAAEPKSIYKLCLNLLPKRGLKHLSECLQTLLAVLLCSPGIQN